MDAIPNETHVAEAVATIAALENGLTRIPLSKAVNTIDGWRRTLLATERDDLRPIAGDLAALHDALTGEGVDGRAVGALLVRLGEQTEAVPVASSTPDDSTDGLRNGLARLGSLLRHAGSALEGYHPLESTATE